MQEGPTALAPRGVIGEQYDYVGWFTLDCVWEQAKHASI
jgi:hypothetical protein